MKLARLIACAALICALPLAAHADEKVATLAKSEVTYTADGTTMKGYLVFDPAQKSPRPGVLVVHEWWGHNAYARQRAEQLARLGYTALAVDMYGDGKTAGHPKDAMAFSKALMGDKAGMKARFMAAKKLLEAHQSTDPDKIAAIGYCMGGAVVLSMAREGVDLDAVASFHGNLATESPAKPGAIKGKILVAHGAADPFVPEKVVDAFKAEMKAAHADMKFVAYPGAKHAFTNPGATAMGEKFSLPLAYDKAADEGSWSELKGLLSSTFR